MNHQLVLSLFPGIGLLDRAFESAGFCVVRGPDLLWGGDVRQFHPPAGRFNGIIGGPPCQCHSSRVHLNRAQGHTIAPDMIPDYLRIVQESDAEWFVMENVPAVPDVELPGYTVQRLRLNARWLGSEQNRERVFQFGSKRGARIDVGPSLSVFDAPTREPCCMASEGRHGMALDTRGEDGSRKSVYRPRRTWARFCELQGLPADFLEDSPFTMEGKYRAVGNGVPLCLGNAIASGVSRAIVPAAERAT